MEAHNIDARTIKEAIMEKKEQDRIQKVTKGINALEQTAERMLKNLWSSSKIQGIGSWEKHLFTEPEIREWIESRGFKIKEEFTGGFYLVIPE